MFMSKKKPIKIGSIVEYVEPYDNQIGRTYLVTEDPDNNGYVTIETQTTLKSSFKAHILDLKHCK